MLSAAKRQGAADMKTDHHIVMYVNGLWGARTLEQFTKHCSTNNKY